MTSIILIAFGVVMIMCPVKYMGLLIPAIGYALLVTATVMVLGFLASKKVLIDYVKLTGALFVGLLGLFVLVQRNDILPALSLLFGLGLVVEGIHDLINAFMYARRAGRAAWGLLALLSVVSIAMGLILLMSSWEDPVTLKRVIGGMMLFSSIVSIIRVILTWPFKGV